MGQGAPECARRWGRTELGKEICSSQALGAVGREPLASGPWVCEPVFLTAFARRRVGPGSMEGHSLRSLKLSGCAAGPGSGSSTPTCSVGPSRLGALHGLSLSDGRFGHSYTLDAVQRVCVRTCLGVGPREVVSGVRVSWSVLFSTVTAPMAPTWLLCVHLPPTWHGPLLVSLEWLQFSSHSFFFFFLHLSPDCSCLETKTSVGPRGPVGFPP